MVQRDSRRLSVRVVLLAVALTLAGAAHAQLPYGTDGATVGGWNFVDYNGTHTGPQFSCDFVVSGATGWCGPGVRQFDATFAGASLDQHLGMISASASVSNPAGSGYRLRSVQATAVGTWWDTFTLSSTTLAAGTTVDVRVLVDLDGTTVVPSLGAPAPYTRLSASINLGGPDAPSVAGLALTSSGTGSASGIQHFLLGPGATFTDFGVIFAATATDLDLIGDYGEATGFAHYYIDVLTPGVELHSASGHDYSFPTTTAVPEADSYAMLLAGLGLLGFMARRRKPKTA